MTRLERVLNQAPDDEIITKSLTTTYQKLKDYDKIFCSIIKIEFIFAIKIRIKYEKLINLSKTNKI